MQLSRSQAQLVPLLFCHLVHMNFIPICKSIHIYISTHTTILSIKQVEILKSCGLTVGGFMCVYVAVLVWVLFF